MVVSPWLAKQHPSDDFFHTFMSFGRVKSPISLLRNQFSANPPTFFPKKNPDHCTKQKICALKVSQGLPGTQADPWQQGLVRLQQSYTLDSRLKPSMWIVLAVDYIYIYICISFTRLKSTSCKPLYKGFVTDNLCSGCCLEMYVHFVCMMISITHLLLGQFESMKDTDFPGCRCSKWIGPVLKPRVSRFILYGKRAYQICILVLLIGPGHFSVFTPVLVCETWVFSWAKYGWIICWVVIKVVKSGYTLKKLKSHQKTDISSGNLT